jgi:hypothetical protein
MTISKYLILLLASLSLSSCTNQLTEIEKRINNIFLAESTSIFDSKTEFENKETISEITIEIKNPKTMLQQGAKSNQIASSTSLLLFNSIDKIKLEQKDNIKIVIQTPSDPFGFNNSFQFPIRNLVTIDSLYKIAINIVINSSLGQSFVSNKHLEISNYNDSMLDKTLIDFKGKKISNDNFQFIHFTFNENSKKDNLSIFFSVESDKLNKMYKIDFNKQTYKVLQIVALR